MNNENNTQKDSNSKPDNSTQKIDHGYDSCSASWSKGRCHSNSPAEHQVPYATQKKARHLHFTRGTLALFIVCMLVLSSLCGFGGAYAGLKIFGDKGNTTGSVSSSGYNLQDSTGSDMSIQDVTEKAQDSVVEIRTEGVSSDSWMRQYVTEGAGSGVIITDDGYIITNNHVIENASKITVTTTDDKSYEAKLIGSDESNDIAVIKIDAKDLSPATYGNSDQLEVGDLSVVIGNPLGQLGGTVTSGIISAKDRELTLDGKTMKLIQTDSSINPGNSGGGMFNSDGQLVGIVVAKSSGSNVEGLGFAIPINVAAEIAQQLMDNGYVKGQPISGMTYTEGSSGFDNLFGASGGTVYIYSVDSSTAKRAGFKSGDVVFAIDGTQITSIDDVTGLISKHKVGDELEYTVVRDGKTKALTIKLQEKK